MGCHAGCGHGGHALVCGSYVGVAAGGPGAEDEDAHCGLGVFFGVATGVGFFFFELVVVGCGDGGTDEQTQLKYTVISGEERSCVVYTKEKKVKSPRRRKRERRKGG